MNSATKVARAFGAVLAACVLVLAGSANAASDQVGRQREDPYQRVLALGDSITFGYGPSPYLDGYRQDLWWRLRHSSYRVDFVGSLKSPSSFWDNEHEGHIGWRIDQLTANIDTWMATYQPDTVLLMAGWNDISQDHDVPNMHNRLGQLIWKIRLARPSVHVFVASLTRHANPAAQAQANTYNSNVAAVVDGMNSGWVHFVPQHLVGGEAKDRWDSVHPSLCGYAKVSWIWWYYMNRSPLNTSGQSWAQHSPNPFYDPNGPCGA